MNARQLDQEIAALKPLWLAAARDAHTCECGAWAEFECGCGNYVDSGEFVLEREVQYLRARILKAEQ
jgi:hypothetical protein